jgi:hypothetical protein
VSWVIDEQSRFRLEIDAPEGIPVIVKLPDGSTHSIKEAREVSLSCTFNHAD